MYKFIIPQEFNQSDKLGKLTMPQAVVLGIGTAFFVIFIVSFSVLTAFLLAIPVAILTFIFMFFRINKVPMYEFVMVYILYAGQPKLLVYRSDNLKSSEEFDDEIGFVEVDEEVRKNPAPAKKKKPKSVKSKSNSNKPVKKVAPAKKSTNSRKKGSDRNKRPAGSKNAKGVKR